MDLSDALDVLDDALSGMEQAADALGELNGQSAAALPLDGSRKVSDARRVIGEHLTRLQAVFDEAEKSVPATERARGPDDEDEDDPDDEDEDDPEEEDEE